VRRALGATLAAWAAFAPHAAAQQVVVTDAGPGQSAAIIRQVVAGPHVVRAGSGRLELPRDSVISSSLLVLGRPTYLASRVQGDVVVVGADLFLRPGVDITGRAVAIGGTVAETTLGQVAGGVESLRDETYVVSGDSTRYSLAYRSDRVEDEVPVFQLAGIKGLLPPRYDRVDGLSLPVGVAFVFAGGAIELQPSVTYRSRLGAWDPAASLRVGPEAGSRFEGRVARDTRTNEGWIYSDLINSATSFFVGTDTRNYFRSDLGEGRLIAHVERNAFTIEPYVGGRYERVSPITSVGNVWSLFERSDTLKMLRPNPLVEKGNIGSSPSAARSPADSVWKRSRASRRQWRRRAFCSSPSTEGSSSRPSAHSGCKSARTASQRTATLCLSRATHTSAAAARSAHSSCWSRVARRSCSWRAAI
jgi:hypothetical protein